MTVKEIMDSIIRATGLQPLPPDRTCDRLVTGTFDQEVTKVGTTFMATVNVIRRAAALGINLIITHEPTWFTGFDSLDWLAGDPVFLAKKKLIEESGIAIYRLHDYMHFAAEDGIYRGIDRELGWSGYRMPLEGDILKGHFDGCYQIPRTTLGELCQFFKRKLNMSVIQIIGDPAQPVERVSILPGGGSLGLGQENMPMRLIHERQLDVLICGEILEWTLPAYIHDAYQLGIARSILVLGHERSEEPGMKYLGEWIKTYLPDIEAVFLDAEEPFTYL
jgi:putative NIF3 family GTP cyclohydrolase 1 type 2